ncbi:regulator of telomere elongation helicase 1 [Lingula anatina]|uniref:Regulator of telomere elongation helicase 1 homolog n=1 Tax=Lingula anatina TaxID=7574 RepID=A0A2R2MTY4_LINAN|nr:regulator of telomere elongation helicase 1 [Lingula anatina]|eukprot:XP_023933588.1 regulator of telomere elongation helicase 1 [Lingula anatina]
MSTIPIRGVPVDFPFDPYPCQKDYMQKVIECLQQNKNGVLESPTGTGKTLCLLCASLAWLHVKKAESQRQQLAAEASSGFTHDLGAQLTEAAGNIWAGGLGVAPSPKIIYASRTHSQLSQAIQELKRTKYSYYRVGILGSRDQMCIHPNVQKEETNTAKVNSCRAKVNARTCHFFNNLDAKKNHPDFFGTGQADPKVLDIEDLVKLGNKHKVCPYYMAKEVKTDADIIFMPYNYLLDPKSRKANGVELQGNVVIFDEAHNLEKICEDSSSFDFTSYDLTTAVQELQQLSEKMIDLYKEEESATVTYGDESEIAPDFNIQQVLQLKSQLLDLEKTLDELELPKDGLTKAGVYIFELFGKVHINFETKSQVLDLIDKIVTHLSSETSAFYGKGVGLSKFADILRIVFSRDPDDMNQSMYNHKAKLAKFYKVHIREDTSRQKKKPATDVWLTNKKQENKGRTVSYWCFSPGHSMKDLESHGVKCIILTSGTLAPLNSFTAEMQIEFPVQLENPHVIEHHQVMIGTVCKGPDGTALNSSYETRYNADYQASLGNAVVNFARIVPNGLLLFFPSYPVMNKCLEYWQANRIWDRIVQYKQIFVEPRGKIEFHQTMEEFYEKINDPKLNGAVFAAVCRGKVSEGLDFADINGRAVVITGLPYPPYMDAKVVLKMKFLDEMQGKQQIKGLTGREWYKQQASRAVNQAIGRVIRHKQDYGAILLCDNRFKSPAAISQLPSWVRSHTKVYENFGQAMKDAMFFFKNAEKMMPAPRLKTRKAESSQLGCQGASFMPSNRSIGSKQQVSQASSVVAHVPGLKEKEDESSLAKLKIQYECSESSTSSRRPSAGGGLLGALSMEERKVEDEGFDLSQNSISVDKMQDKVTSSKVQRKKIILKDRPKFDGGMSSECELTKDEKKNLPAAKVYLMQVKQALSQASYKLFSSTLFKYQKDGNFTSMIANMAEIFTDEPKNHELLRRLYRFVRSDDKYQFDQVCRDLTGQGCLSHPETGPRKRVQEQFESNSDKRRKLEDGSSKGPVLDTKSTSKTGAESEGNLHHLNSTSNLSVKALTAVKDINSSNVTTVKTLVDKETDLLNGCVKTNLADSKSEENVNVLASNQDERSKHYENEEQDKNEQKELFPEISQEELDRVKSFTSYDPPPNSGYLCAVCKKESKIPLKSPCDHYACFKCWKMTLQSAKQCPVCGQEVRRRQLTKLYFPSGPLRGEEN